MRQPMKSNNLKTKNIRNKYQMINYASCLYEYYFEKIMSLF